MKHRVHGKKLSRTKNERRLLFRNLLRELIDHGKLRTTLTKAKVIQPMVEKLITKAKKQTDIARRELFAVLTDKAIVTKLMQDATGRFSVRTSGYTRLMKTGLRRGDGTAEALLSFVDEKQHSVVAEKDNKKTVRKSLSKPKTEKRTLRKVRAKKKNT